MAAANRSRYFASATITTTTTSPHFADHFEFDESEVWSSTDPTTRYETRSSDSNPRRIQKPVRKAVDLGRATVGPKSLPVNIPDWSRILKDEYNARARDYTDDLEDEEEDEEDGDDRIPPHEYLARTRAASLSVHEGIGRTLKGRDLSRVRNAIWKKTGFED